MCFFTWIILVAYRINSDSMMQRHLHFWTDNEVKLPTPLHSHVYKIEKRNPSSTELKVNCNVFTSCSPMIEFGPQNTVSKLFLKNLFSFLRYRPLKSGTSAGSILGFTCFPENNNRKTFICDVTSDQSSLITERSNLRDRKASGNC